MPGKLSFIGGGEFWSMFTAYRIVWINGRFGGGKTSLAAILAFRLLAEGYVDHVWSNVPMTIATPPGRPYDHVGIVLDEPWLYLETRRDVADYAGFVRKFEHYLILPGVFPVHARLCFFRVARIWNGYTMGLPLWLYSWSLRMADIRERGRFGIWNPKAIFGHYPTRYVPGTDGGISDVIMAAAKEAGYQGTRAEQRAAALATRITMGMAEQGAGADSVAGMDGNLSELVERMDDQAFEFGEAAESFEESRRKGIKARRF